MSRNGPAGADVRLVQGDVGSGQTVVPQWRTEAIARGGQAR